MNKNLLNKVSSNNLKVLLDSLGYTYFDTPYVLNIVGVRANELNSNEFNDIIIVEYTNNNDEIITKYYKATTDPGIKSRLEPINIKGCAILVEGQYIDCWKKGLHKGKKGLIQCKNVKVYRDNSKDELLELKPSTIDTGLFGINIHRAGGTSVLVDGWSAGCQVLANNEDFEEFYKLVELCSFKPNYSYTLINESDYE